MSIHAILFLEKTSPSVLYRGQRIKYYFVTISFLYIFYYGLNNVMSNDMEKNTQFTKLFFLGGGGGGGGGGPQEDVHTEM